jgi:hypothetical protein
MTIGDEEKTCELFAAGCDVIIEHYIFLKWSIASCAKPPLPDWECAGVCRMNG